LRIKWLKLKLIDRLELVDSLGVDTGCGSGCGLGSGSGCGSSCSIFYSYDF